MGKRVKITSFTIKSLPKNVVYVGRPTKYGNPFSVNQFGRHEAVKLYKSWIYEQVGLWGLDLSFLQGKDLACWCGLHEECHADVLLNILESMNESS